MHYIGLNSYRIDNALINQESETDNYCILCRGPMQVNKLYFNHLKFDPLILRLKQIRGKVNQQNS